METVLVELKFPQPMEYNAFETIKREGDWCFRSYGLTLLQTYVSLDSKRYICVFRAPDAEAVRVAARSLGVTIESAWPVDVHVNTEAAEPPVD